LYRKIIVYDMVRFRFLLIFSGILLSSFIPTQVNKESVEKQAPVAAALPSPVKALYVNMQLESILKYEAFEQAMEGYTSLSAENKDILTIVDFSLPSTAKRMYVLDMKNRKLLFHTIVSHGKNSGDNYATSFSNRLNSYQSSLGFFLTENTYQGENGYSLVLNGLEEGINDQAKARAVVIHGADYCSEGVIASLGRLGRSYGCPALPRALTKPIINTIKEGSLLYIYAENSDYAAESKILNSTSTRLAAQDSGLEHTAKRL